jgi:hypothetical protein
MLDPALACLVALPSPSDSKGTRVPGISNNESLWVGAGYARNVASKKGYEWTGEDRTASS